MIPENRDRTLLVLVAVAALVVVWTSFNPTPHAGGDNSGYVALAHGLLTGQGYTDVFDPARLPHTKYPHVFPAFLAVLMALGARTWAALKLSAAIPTVLTAALTFLWAKRRLTSIESFAVALLVVVSAGFVYYSQWILSDPLFVAFTMLALWAFDVADEEDSRAGWVVLGVLATGLAFFTRSAGLPLVVAALGWLALRRRWLALGASAVALGVPMGLWALRGRGEGVAQYGTEFWMVDPYQPALGTIGPLGLLPRVLENLQAYVLQHGPAGVIGAGRPGVALLGVVLTGAALGGWLVTVRRRFGVADLFVPLYVGLLLLWPAVWGGDRFALPLYPLLFLYAGVALHFLRIWLPPFAGGGVAAVAFLVVFLPAAGTWLDGAEGRRRCETVARRSGPWACYGPNIGYFVDAATWSATGLPPGAAVFTRKPRHFYLMSGHPSRTFPFVGEAAEHLALADALGVRYVLLDQWDGLAAAYVGGAVRERPGAFCWLRAFGPPAEGGAQLLGILPPELRDGSPTGADGTLQPCPPGYLTGTEGPPADYVSSGRIPLLSDLDP